MRTATAMGALLGVLLLAAAAHAQTTYSGLEDETPVASPQWGSWEIFAVGPYQPRLNKKASSTLSKLGSDHGPLLSTEMDVNLWRIPHLGPIQAGLRAGWAKYEGPAVDANGQPTGEKSKVLLFPFTPMAVLRIDALANELHVPILIAGKAGLQITPYRITKGGKVESNGKGIELGFRWGAEVALQLDFLEPRAARRLDEEWGINHSFIFGELFGSTAKNYGDPFSFTFGLGFDF